MGDLLILISAKSDTFDRPGVKVFISVITGVKTNKYNDDNCELCDLETIRFKAIILVQLELQRLES